MRIVLIEDNAILSRALVQALQHEGHAVDWLADGAQGDTFLAQNGADMVIVDINLPGMSGLQVLRALRGRAQDFPVLVLTAQGQVADRVAGLDAGADDYLVKPFDMAELLARIRALSRRSAGVLRACETVGALTYDHGARQLHGADGPLEVSRRELALFEAFLDNPGRVLSKDQLCDRIYGVGADVEPNAVELLVSRLRRKLGGQGVTIRTLRGLGYCLQAEQP